MKPYITPRPKGNPSEYSFEDIYKEYWESFRSYAFSSVRDYHESEDLAQEMMIRVLKNMKWIDSSRFETGIALLVRSVMINYYQKSNGLSHSLVGEDLEDHDICEEHAQYNMEGEMEYDEWMYHLHSILREEDKELYHLHYVENKSAKEVAAILKISTGNYYIKIHRLKEYLSAMAPVLRERINEAY